MNLYLITFDSQEYFVEAETMFDALDIWREHVRIVWGSDYEGTEEPEQCSLVSDAGPVLRRQA